MTRARPAHIWTSLAALALLVTACDEDDNPVTGGGGPTCYDDSTTCVRFHLTPSDMSYQATNDNDEIVHQLTWSVPAGVIPDYAPGRIVVTLTFVPPLEVRYSHASHQFMLLAGARAGCFDRFATATATLESLEWASTGYSVDLQGQCDTGESGMGMAAIFSPMQAGDRLKSLTFDFVVPSTYTFGGASGTPVLSGDLAISFLGFLVILGGDTMGNPPIWPRSHPLPVGAPSASERGRRR